MANVEKVENRSLAQRQAHRRAECLQPKARISRGQRENVTGKDLARSNTAMETKHRRTPRPSRSLRTLPFTTTSERLRTLQEDGEDETNVIVVAVLMLKLPATSVD